MVYYIILKSVHHEKIFSEDGDYREYLNLMKTYALKYKLDLMGFLLLPTEVHLLLESENLDSDLLPFLHLLSFRYRAVLQDRPKVILIEKDPYLLELTCYLHLRPVAANLVRKPSDYRFSSYPIYIGKDSGLDIKVDSDCVLKNLSSSRQESIALYRQLMESDCCGRIGALKKRIKEDKSFFESKLFALRGVN